MLTSPHDLMAAVPFLLGYQPLDSIVLISLKGESVGMAMRIDFPLAIDTDQIESVLIHLEREHTESVLLVAYAPEAFIDSDLMLDAFANALSLKNISLREAIVIQNQRWRSRLCSDKSCCPVAGNPLPEFKEARITAELVAQGKPLPYANVEDLKSSIAAKTPPIELIAELSRLSPIDYESDVLIHQQEGALAVSKFVEIFSSTESVDPKLSALVLMRLTDLQVRDFALGIVTAETIENHWAAWRWLLTLAPSGFVAPVASLFAAISYEKGDALLAQHALNRAFADDAEYPLAQLLRRVFTANWPPETFATMRRELHPKVERLIFGSQLGVA